MKRICSTVLLFALFSFSACMPQFEVKPLGDKFSDPSLPYGFAGMNNRLSTKSSQGGLHADDRGVYLNPYVYKDKKTYEIVDAGFFISHYNFDLEDGFRPIQQIVFLTDSGDRVAVIATNYDSEYKVGSWNSIARKYIGSYTEQATSRCALDDFSKLCNAKRLEVKIIGGKRSQTYSSTEVSESFLLNLGKFYASQFK